VYRQPKKISWIRKSENIDGIKGAIADIPDGRMVDRICLCG